MRREVFRCSSVVGRRAVAVGRSGVYLPTFGECNAESGIGPVADGVGRNI